MLVGTFEILVNSLQIDGFEQPSISWLIKFSRWLMSYPILIYLLTTH